MELTGKETDLQRDLINAAKAATMLFMYVCRELDADHPQTPGFAAKNPDSVAACMSAAALLHMTSIQPLGFKLPRPLLSE